MPSIALNVILKTRHAGLQTVPSGASRPADRSTLEVIV